MRKLILFFLILVFSIWSSGGCLFKSLTEVESEIEEVVVEPKPKPKPKKVVKPQVQELAPPRDEEEYNNPAPVTSTPTGSSAIEKKKKLIKDLLPNKALEKKNANN